MQGDTDKPIILMRRRAVIDLNLNGTFAVCSAAMDQYMFDNGGSIVNIVANYFNGFPLMAHTGAARAGVANLTETLALEWASSGVRVNAVAPGIIYSESSKENYVSVEALAGKDILGQQAAFTPAGRIGSVEEVAACVVFLLSPAAAFVTGACLRVDGGAPLIGQGNYVLTEHNGRYPSFGTLPPKPKL